VKWADAEQDAEKEGNDGEKDCQKEGQKDRENQDDIDL
jgi:hypothetical protein